uniref:Uncharacterized protein n=1 Tax=Ascaris lumbricoides TaxID=6252 RepID=A0A0M3I1B3_ASCLU
MRNAERQCGAHVSLEKQQLFVKGDIVIIWTQSESKTETADAEWKCVLMNEEARDCSPLLLGQSMSATRPTSKANPYSDEWKGKF